MKDKIKLFGFLFLSGACIGKALLLAERTGRIESANDIDKKIWANKDVEFPSGRKLVFKHSNHEKES